MRVTVFWLFLLPLSIFAQSPVVSDTAQVRTQIQKAAGLIKTGAVVDAARILEEARQVLLQSKDTLTPIFADL